jgi:hypothetical protein
MRLRASGLDPGLTCVVVGSRSLVFARQGALQRRHPLRVARCTRLVEVVDARASLSIFRAKRSIERCRQLLSAANPVFNEHPEVRSNPVR